MFASFCAIHLIHVIDFVLLIITWSIRNVQKTKFHYIIINENNRFILKLKKKVNMPSKLVSLKSNPILWLTEKTVS